MVDMPNDMPQLLHAFAFYKGWI